MLYRKTFLLLSFLFLWLVNYGQPPAETWLAVTKVRVEGQGDMTPVGRWFRLGAEGQVSGGNGGIIHTRGSYSIAGDSLLFYNEFGTADPFGAFRQKQTGDTITWHRTENDMEVTVHLLPTGTYPLGPWDHILGTWERTDLPGGQIYMRWDREYRLRGDWLTSGSRGVWHIRAHNPELRIISEGENPVVHSFTVAFPEPGQMTWTRGDIVWLFRRVPE